MGTAEYLHEEDFLGFSYGFRIGRSQHDALDALSVAISSKRINWILDADIESFFDTIDHEWLIQFLEHRIGDRRVLRLIRKWLRTGIREREKGSVHEAREREERKGQKKERRKKGSVHANTWQ